MVRRLKKHNKIKHLNDTSKKGNSSFSSIPLAPTKVWELGVDKLEEGEELQYDPSMYNYLRSFFLDCSCLSFDILHDSLGLVRSEFPHTIYGVTGSQAAAASLNYIAIFKVSNISGKKRDLVPLTSTDEDIDMDDESSSDEEDVYGPPILQSHKVAHQGSVNRIRAMPQKSHICATWADRGHVQVWNFESQLSALQDSEAQNRYSANNINHAAPMFKFNGHKDEGFALDWSPVVPGRLISGDCNSCIHLWEPSSNSWNVDKNPFVGHKGSVEDLQALIFSISFHPGHSGVPQKRIYLLHVLLMEIF